MFQFPSFPSLSLYIQLRIPAHYDRWVPPFGNPRLSGYLLLPAAFRSLSRPSSAPSAKASALCPSLLDLFFVNSLCEFAFSLFWFLSVQNRSSHLFSRGPSGPCFLLDFRCRFRFRFFFVSYSVFRVRLESLCLFAKYQRVRVSCRSLRSRETLA